MNRVFRTPLARWGFTVCAVAALATAQPGPFLVTTVLAAYAWRCRR
ncbi:hypothetical protein JL475_24385 [Streptomyces sp. M2CJ-2]|nr:hypothetical protein [Streptomyces sp. M2CJ-2]MBL3669074.1 hypothetical protein [Streptomyces sp. M2CJ-2]